MDWLTICADGQTTPCIPGDKIPYVIAILVGTVLLAVMARRTRDLSTAALTLMAVAIAINLVLGSLTVALRLPLYLDSVGTILVGALAGPWAGALTGVLANLLWSFLPIPGGSGPVAAFFAPVAAVIGLMAGFWASRGVFQVGAGDGRIGGFLALATGLGVALLGIVVAANTVGYAVAQDDPSSGDRFLVTTAVIVVLGVVAAVASGRTIFRLDGRPAAARRYLVVAATLTATVLVIAILRLLFSPTGYFSRVDGSDPEGPDGPLFGGADLSGLALQDPLGLWAAIAVGLLVGGLVYLWARRGENVRFFPVWVGGITTALVGTTIATPIAAYVFGGVTGGGTDALVAVFRSLGLDVLQAVFLQSLLSDPLDKAISYTIVFLILGALPITVRTMYSRGEATVAG
jgi:hypothetical protein